MMTNLVKDSAVTQVSVRKPHLYGVRMLTSVLPFVALAIPGHALAADAVNTATISVPAGAIDPDTSNNTVTDSDTILAALVANDDTASGVFGLSGGNDVISVLSNDTFNTVGAATSGVTISVASGFTVPSQLAFDTTTGLVDVVAGTPAGTYTFDYTICETANLGNCQTATVSVTVTAPTILADDDSAGGINGTAGGTDVLDLLNGDVLGGSPATTSNVTVSVLTAATAINGGPVPTLNSATGLISVPASTPAGDYNITYRICDSVNTSSCDDAVATITVVAAPIAADNESISGVNGANGGSNVVNVLDGDTFNGNPATVGTVDLTVVTPATPINGGPVPTLDITSGNVSVPAGTPAGDYTITYQICDPVNPSNCATGTVTITVAAPAILADPDSVSGVNGQTGASDVLDVLAGDTLNGAPATASTVTLTVVTAATPIGGGNVPTLNTTTGLVSVPAGTPAGSYTIEYQICDPLNSGNCAIETATIVVAPSVDLSITKRNDTDEVTSGTDVTYILEVSNAGPDAATGAVVSDTPGAGLTCPVNGSVTITGAGVPVGTFTIGDLTGTGITLGTISAGQMTTITYTCSVN